MNKYTAQNDPISQNPLFNLSLKQKADVAEITMNLLTEEVSTHHFPQTYALLERLLPSIFEHKCFNGDELPFSEEVLNTEVGHLFEHVLMEYLHQLKKESRLDETKITGETAWDWSKEERGTFHIVITSKKSETALLRIALDKAINITQIILNSGSTFQELSPKIISQ